MTIITLIACPPGVTIDFDVAATAGFYSQLAGVLAGFAFTALVFLITTRLSNSKGASEVSGDAFADAYRVLAAAFLGLLLTSLNYAVFAGDKIAAGRTASEESILGTGFAVSALLLIYAIVLILDGAELASPDISAARRSVAISVRDSVAIYIAPLVVLYINLGNTDYEASRYGAEHGLTALSILGWLVVGLQAIISWGIYPVLSRAEHRSWQERSRKRAVIWTSRSFLGLAVGTSVVFGLIDTGSDLCGTLHPAFPGGALLATFASMVGATVVLAKTRPSWKLKA
jgi:hypothetical protein